MGKGKFFNLSHLSSEASAVYKDANKPVENAYNSESSTSVENNLLPLDKLIVFHANRIKILEYLKHRDGYGYEGDDTDGEHRIRRKINRFGESKRYDFDESAGKVAFTVLCISPNESESFNCYKALKSVSPGIKSTFVSQAVRILEYIFFRNFDGIRPEEKLDTIPSFRTEIEYSESGRRHWVSQSSTVSLEYNFSLAIQLLCDIARIDDDQDVIRIVMGIFPTLIASEAMNLNMFVKLAMISFIQYALEWVDEEQRSILKLEQVIWKGISDDMCAFDIFSFFKIATNHNAKTRMVFAHFVYHTAYLRYTGSNRKPVPIDEYVRFQPEFINTFHMLDPLTKIHVKAPDNVQRLEVGEFYRKLGDILRIYLEFVVLPVKTLWMASSKMDQKEAFIILRLKDTLEIITIHTKKVRYQLSPVQDFKLSTINELASRKQELMKEWVKSDDLPAAGEIREEINKVEKILESANIENSELTTCLNRVIECQNLAESMNYELLQAGIDAAESEHYRGAHIRKEKCYREARYQVLKFGKGIVPSCAEKLKESVGCDGEVGNIFYPFLQVKTPKSVATTEIVSAEHSPPPDPSPGYYTDICSDSNHSEATEMSDYSSPKPDPQTPTKPKPRRRWREKPDPTSGTETKPSQDRKSRRNRWKPKDDSDDKKKPNTMFIGCAIMRTKTPTDIPLEKFSQINPLEKPVFDTESLSPASDSSASAASYPSTSGVMKIRTNSPKLPRLIWPGDDDQIKVESKRLVEEHERGKLLVNKVVQPKAEPEVVVKKESVKTEGEKKVKTGPTMTWLVAPGAGDVRREKVKARRRVEDELRAKIYGPTRTSQEQKERHRPEKVRENPLLFR